MQVGLQHTYTSPRSETRAETQATAPIRTAGGQAHERIHLHLARARGREGVEASDFTAVVGIRGRRLAIVVHGADAVVAELVAHADVAVEHRVHFDEVGVTQVGVAHAAEQRRGRTHAAVDVDRRAEVVGTGAQALVFVGGRDLDVAGEIHAPRALQR